MSIGHRAIVHGCTLKNGSLVGMGAIVMDKVVVGENAVIAAGAVVTQGTQVPPGTLWAGVPARQIKVLDPEQIADLNVRIAKNYLNYADWYRQ